MSAYCTIDDVRSIVDSDMTDPEISILIDIISAFIPKPSASHNITNPRKKGMRLIGPL